MGRFLMYASIAALAVFVFSAYVLLEHGGKSIGADRSHSIHDLSEQYPVFEGTSLTTQGQLSFSEEHDRYQIVDEGNFALIISSYHDTDALAGLVGTRVRVTGTFHNNDELGLHIDAEAVVPVTTPAPVGP